MNGGGFMVVEKNNPEGFVNQLFMFLIEFAARGEQATLRFREIFLEQAANFRELRMHGWLATHTPHAPAPTHQRLERFLHEVEIGEVWSFDMRDGTRAMRAS